MRIQQAQGQQLSPAQRAELFAVHTRQHINELPAMVGLGADRTVNFTLPKTRLLSKIALAVEGELTIATAAATALARFSPYNILRRVQVSINNGFNPEASFWHHKRFRLLQCISLHPHGQVHFYH